MNRNFFCRRLFRTSAIALSGAFTLMICASLHAEWNKFTVEEGFIVFEIEMAGRPARALLDTGASRNVIDVDFVEEHGGDFIKSHRVNIRGVHDTEEVRMYSEIPVNFLGTELTLTDVMAVDLGGTDMLVSGGMFRNVITQIDYPNSRLQILPKNAVDMNLHSNVRMKRASGSLLPAVQVELNGKKTWLLLDTGNAGGIYLQRDFALNERLFTEETPMTSTFIQGVNGMASAETFYLDSVKFGPYDMENVMIHVPSEGQDTMLAAGLHETKTGTRIKQGVKYKGILGYDILKHFVLTIDYGRYKINVYAP